MDLCLGAKEQPPDRFWHIVYGMGADQLQTALALAKQRNAGWVYLTQEEGNPYARPPQYWKAEAAAVEQQGVQAPFASAWPDSFDDQGARMRGRTSIRWGGASAANWQIFLDTDQNSKTGYSGGGIAVGAEFMFETDDGTAHLWRYAGTGQIGTGRKSPRMPRSTSSIPVFRPRASTLRPWAARRL